MFILPVFSDAGKAYMRFLSSIWVLFGCVLSAPAAEILIFNPQPRPVTADVAFSPEAAGLKGVPANRVRVAASSQVEDSDLDGKWTDKDTVYTRILAQPGNNWLDVRKGTPQQPKPEITVQKSADVWRTGWLELDVKTGRPIRWRVGDEWKPVTLDLGTACGDWQSIPGKVTISDLPLRSRVDFLSQGESPAQVTVFVYPAGRAEVEVHYPKEPAKKAWQENNDIACRPYLSHGVGLQLPLPADARYNWLTKSGTWYETTSGRLSDRARLFFGGLAYPELGAGLGFFVLDADLSTSEKPCAMRAGTTQDNKAWRLSPIVYSVSPQLRFAIVRYELPKDPAKTPDSVKNLYYLPEVYMGNQLREMIEARAKITQNREAQSALRNGDPVLAMSVLEQARQSWLGDARKTIANLKNTQSPAVRAAVGEAETLLLAQQQDRCHPRRFMRYPWGESPSYTDRLIRADHRLARCREILVAAEPLATPEKSAIAKSLVTGPGEVFRAGFGECGGLQADLLQLFWGYDYFKPLVDLGIRSFHFQAMWWSCLGDPSGNLRDIAGYDRLFTDFDCAGVTAVPQILPWNWCGIPDWMKDKFQDSTYEYMFEQAGADGKIMREKRRNFTWMSPAIWGSMLSFQQGYADFCRKIVAQFSSHPSIIGWAEHNETGASAEDAFSGGSFPIEGFRKYLKRKYGTIELLNKAWASSYPSFDRIPPDAPKQNVVKAISASLDGPWKFAVDPDRKGKSRKWSAVGFDDRAWETIKVPGYWEEQFPKHQKYDGLAWYRRSVAIPADWAGKIIRLRCDGIDDEAEIFVNGKLALKNVGFNIPVDLEISGLVQPEHDNTLAICVNDTFANGGIYKSVTLTAESPQTPPSRFKQPQRQLDREMYAQENAADVCGYFSSVIHGADPQHRPAFLKEWVLKTPSECPESQLDSFIAARAHVGVAGCDMYKSMNWYPMAIDILRSAGDAKPVWLMETLYYAPSFCSPASLDQWTWSMAVRGLRSVYFWISDQTAYEGDCGINDFGVGVATMQKKFDVLAPVIAARRNVQLAIYLPRDSQFLCDRRTIDNGWQRLYWMLSAMNVPVDFLDDGKIAAGKLKTYKCLIVPLSPYMPQSTASAIGQFVREGASVILSAGSAAYDYQGNIFEASPGLGLREMVGAQVLTRNPESGRLRLKGDFTSAILDGNVGILTHRLKPQTAKAIFGGEGRVALTQITVGRGLAFLSALDLGVLFATMPEEKRCAIVQIVRDLLKTCRVQPPLVCYHPGVEAHVLQKEKLAYLVLINHNADRQQVKVDFSTPWKIACDVLTLQSVDLKQTGPHTQGVFTITGNASAIFRLME